MANEKNLPVEPFVLWLPNGLVRPTIPGTDPVDGLLPVAHFGTPLNLHLAVWEEALPGDAYQLEWNGMLKGPSKIITATEKPGDPLILDIPSFVWEQEGTHLVRYVATDTGGGLSNPSPSAPLIIDRTAPGGPLLSPLIFPVLVQNLSHQDIVNLGGVLTARLPGYFDAKWGDVVRTYWDAQAGPTHTVRAEDLTASHIDLSFDQTFLEQLADGEVQVTYTVTDRAGNVSVASEPSSIKLNFHNLPSDLLPPVVPQAQDGLIDNADARHGVQVQIPSYTHAQPGDVVRISWSNMLLGEHALTAEQVAQTPLLTQSVPYATLIEAGDGNLPVNYQIIRDGQVQATSPNLEVKVQIRLPGPQDASPETLINESLAAPVIKGKSEHPNRDDNLIDEDDYLLNADALIAWRDEFRPCDQVNLFWGTCPVPIQRVLNQNDIDAARDVAICVPNRVIVEEGVCKAIDVRYTVTHPDNPNTSYAPSQSVRVICRAQLPGGENVLPAPVFVEANIGNTLDVDAGATGTRLLVKPYRNMRVGDQIRLSFAGFDDFVAGQRVDSTSIELEQIVTEQDLLQGSTFFVPPAFLTGIDVGRAEARYFIKNAFGIAHSLKADVYVDLRLLMSGCSRVPKIM